MKRRVFAFISAALLLIGNMLLFAVPAFAESTEKVGYWKLISVENVGPNSQFDDAKTSGGSGHYTCTAKCTDSRITANFSSGGDVPAGEIRFTGGLANLERLANKHGATVTASAGDRFTLSLTFFQNNPNG